MAWLFLPLMYLSGSVPYGLLLGFLAGADVRTQGSGNIGFTNVLRVCGAKWGVPVLLLDLLKGYLPLVLLAPVLAGEGHPQYTLILVLGGVCAILGHNFPVWLKFKGGKGVATSSAVIFALMPYPLLIGVGVFLLLLAIFRYVSLGSMIGSFAVLVAQILLADAPFGTAQLPRTILAGVAFLLLILRHRSNIGRLLRGEENKIGSKKKTDAAEVSAAGNEEAADTDKPSTDIAADKPAQPEGQS